jgi:hypothetical protein
VAPDSGDGHVDSIAERWIVFVTAEDRSGTLTALAEMFSSRGVSFTSFNTLTVAGGAGTMSIIFRGTPRLARVLARTLERLAVTRTVTLVRASDPGVRGLAVVADAGSLPASEHTASRCTVTPWGDAGTVLIAGALADVEDAVERMSGATLEAFAVLPPR